MNYTPMEMYELVNDVRSYPVYIPLCSEVKLLSCTPERLRATITLSKGAVRLAFTTENTMDTGRSIRMTLVDGPFKRLNGLWRFEPEGEAGCRTSFRLDFEFSNALVGMAFGGFFREASESMVEAFRRQAVRVYGERGRPGAR